MTPTTIRASEYARAKARAKSRKAVTMLVSAFSLTLILFAGGIAYNTFLGGGTPDSGNSGGGAGITATPEPTPTPSPTQKPVDVVRTNAFYYPNWESEEKIVYLTFDDGPSRNVTPKILDTLQEYGVKATFFVLGTMAQQNPDLVLRIYGEGHAIGNHTVKHNYSYASTETLLEDIWHAEEIINGALGFEYNNHLFRFPGGSGDKKSVLKDAVLDAGFQYFDWNCLGNDAVSVRGSTADYIVSETIRTAKEQTHLTVLLHDTTSKMTTADALPRIIEHFAERGFVFRTLDESNTPPPVIEEPEEL